MTTYRPGFIDRTLRLLFPKTIGGIADIERHTGYTDGYKRAMEVMIELPDKVNFEPVTIHAARESNTELSNNAFVGRNSSPALIVIREQAIGDDLPHVHIEGNTLYDTDDGGTGVRFASA